MADPYVPIQTGADLGAGASATFDLGVFAGRVSIMNSGPDVVAFNFTNAVPVGTARGVGQNVLPTGAVQTVEVSNIRYVSVLAGAAGAGVDILALPGDGLPA